MIMNVKKPTALLAMATLTLTALSACESSSKSADPGNSTAPQSAPESAPQSTQSHPCLDAVHPSAGAVLIASTEWIDGEQGEYDLEDFQVATAFINSGDDSTAIEAGVATFGPIDPNSARPGNPRMVCMGQLPDVSGYIGVEYLMPSSISRTDAGISSLLDLSGIHHTYISQPESVSAKMERSAFPDFFSLSANAANRDVYFDVYRQDARHIQIYVTQTAHETNGTSELRALATYRYVPSAPAPAPVAVPSPQPVPTPTPTPTPVPVPTPVPTTTPPANVRCGVDGSYVTVDGNDSFYYGDSTDRMSGLARLVSSGFCSARSRLGVDGSYVTVDGNDAFYYSSSNERMIALLRLYQSGIGSTQASKCGVDGSYITLNGQDAFYFGDSDQRLAKLIELVNSGLCR